MRFSDKSIAFKGQSACSYAISACKLTSKSMVIGQQLINENEEITKLV